MSNSTDKNDDVSCSTGEEILVRDADAIANLFEAFRFGESDVISKDGASIKVEAFELPSSVKAAIKQGLSGAAKKPANRTTALKEKLRKKRRQRNTKR